jgi:uncharacterized protein
MVVMAVVVSDTSPLRALAHLHCLPWLNDFFGSVVLPPAVAAELASPPLGLPVVEVSAWPFLSIQAPQNVARVRQLRLQLDMGECEALVLAEELHADAVLMDELAGRGIAVQRGLVVIGTLGLLIRAKHQGLCKEIRPLLDRLQTEINFFVAPALRELVLAQIGELAR